MRLLITGSRDWPYPDLISQSILTAAGTAPRDITVVHGACPTGADKMADDIARRNGIRVERWPADWNRHGRGAGLIRNNAMLDTMTRDNGMIVAFILDNSRGASYTLAGAVNRRLWWISYHARSDTPGMISYRDIGLALPMLFFCDPVVPR